MNQELCSPSNVLRKTFYERVGDCVSKLNPKFQAKAFINRDTCTRMINILRGVAANNGESTRFVRWCQDKFCLRLIGGNYVLCDMKSKRPILLFEEMFDVYRMCHIQTAHGGRDKCLDYISKNYSWVNRSFLQIYLELCSACQNRKAIKTPIVSKPIIALGIDY